MNTNVIESTAVKGVETGNQEGGITMKESVYTFRTLNSTDVFLMFKILKNIGIREFASCFEKTTVKQMVTDMLTDESESDNTRAVGIAVMLELADIVIGNIPKCENEIYQLLSNTSNLTVEQVKKLDFITFTEMVIDFVKKDEFKDFIKVVLRLFKSEK